jgi:hypothetical protein
VEELSALVPSTVHILLTTLSDAPPTALGAPGNLFSMSPTPRQEVLQLHRPHLAANHLSRPKNLLRLNRLPGAYYAKESPPS